MHYSRITRSLDGSCFSCKEKKNVIWRFCADHGRLNAIPKQFVYLLPRIHDAIDDFSRPRMFSTSIFGRGIGRFSYTPATMKREHSSLYTFLYEFSLLIFVLCNGSLAYETFVGLNLKGVKCDILMLP